MFLIFWFFLLYIYIYILYKHTIRGIIWDFGEKKIIMKNKNDIRALSSGFFSNTNTEERIKNEKLNWDYKEVDVTKEKQGRGLNLMSHQYKRCLPIHANYGLVSVYIEKVDLRT